MYIVTTVQIDDYGHVSQFTPKIFKKKEQATIFMDKRFTNMVEAFSYDCGYDDDISMPTYKRIKSGASGITTIIELHEVGDLI